MEIVGIKSRKQALEDAKDRQHEEAVEEVIRLRAKNRELLREVKKLRTEVQFWRQKNLSNDRPK